MKYRRIMIAIFGIAAILVLFAGCNRKPPWKESEQYPGLRFHPLSSYYYRYTTDKKGRRGTEYKKLSFTEQYSGNTDEVYICEIQKDCPDSVVIPSVFDGIPVVALTGPDSAETLTSLEIENGIRYIERCCLHGSGLKSIYIPDSVEYIYNSFDDCEAVSSLTINGNIDLIYNSFSPRPEKVIIYGKIKQMQGVFAGITGERTRDTGLILLYDDAQIPEDHFADRSDIVAHVTDTLYEYRDGFDPDALMEEAKKHIGAELPEEKKISLEEAPRYAQTLNGPVIGMRHCPDCVWTKRKDYQSRLFYTGQDAYGVYYVPVDEIEYNYPNTLYTEEKAKKVMQGETPLVYCLSEKIGHSENGVSYVSGPDMKQNLNALTWVYYHMVFRISFWEEGADEPIAWYLYESGKERKKVTNTADIYFVDGVYDGYLFLLEEGLIEPTSLTTVEKTVYGK